MEPPPSSLSSKQKWRLKQQSRVTSWYNSYEFDHVGQCLGLACQLFSPSINMDSTIPVDEASSTDSTQQQSTNAIIQQYDEILNAIQRVSVWRSRAENNGRLPHSIEITSSLAETLVQDAKHQEQIHKHYIHQNDTLKSSAKLFCNSHDTNITTSTSLRLTYASILIRGVNGIADSMQKNRILSINNNNNYGSSIANLCSIIGLPSWIVDLRHDASHNELPSLITLRLGAQVLLQFLIDKYWIVLRDIRQDWRQRGLDLIMEWKNLNKLNTYSNKIGGGSLTQKKNTTKSSKEAQLENDNKNTQNEGDIDDDNNKDDQFLYGAYSIFLEKKESKKKKAQKGKTGATITTDKTTTTNNANNLESNLRTAQECFKDFITTIPIDMAMEILKMYLVFGGVADAPQGRGVLIPGSAEAFPQSIDGVRKVRERYGSTLLVPVAAIWPGFIHCILVNLVEFIFVLEGQLTREFEEDTEDHTNSEIMKLSSNNEMKTGLERKLYFLYFWVKYLLSKEFYHCLGWDGVINTEKLGGKKNDKWSPDQLLMLESNAPLKTLQMAQLPLNSLCDRCIIGGETIWSKDIASLLNDILGTDDRVIGNGIFGIQSDTAKKRKVKSESSSQQAKKSKHTIKSLMDINDDSNIERKENDSMNRNMTSLEDIEAMLSHDGDHKVDDDDREVDGVHGNQSICEEKNEKKDTHTEFEKESKRIITPWTLCLSWDQCAMGTLPGYAT